MKMQLAVGVLASGLLFGCGGAELEAAPSEENTVTASADLLAARFEVKPTGAAPSPCTSAELRAADAHMVRNFGKNARMVDCNYHSFGGVGFIEYTYYLAER
jgi:hypothetical protein